MKRPTVYTLKRPERHSEFSCPACGSQQLHGGTLSVLSDGKGVTQPTTCFGCGLRFHSMYTFSQHYVSLNNRGRTHGRIVQDLENTSSYPETKEAPPDHDLLPGIYAQYGPDIPKAPEWEAEEQPVIRAFLARIPELSGGRLDLTRALHVGHDEEEWEAEDRALDVALRWLADHRAYPNHRWRVEFEPFCIGLLFRRDDED